MFRLKWMQTTDVKMLLGQMLHIRLLKKKVAEASVDYVYVKMAHFNSVVCLQDKMVVLQVDGASE